MTCLPFKGPDPAPDKNHSGHPRFTGLHLIYSCVIVAGLLAFNSLSAGQSRALAAKAQLETGTPQSGEIDGLAQAKSLLAKGSIKEADSVVREYLRHNSKSAHGHFLLGYILFKEQKPADSLAEFTEGAKFHDPGAFDLKVVALDYVLLGDYVDADHWLVRSLQSDPNDSEAWYYLGRTKYNENMFPEAIKAFEQCLKLDHRNVKAEDNLGLSYQGLGRTDEAFAAYRKAIVWQQDILNKNPGPLINLGGLLIEQNRVEEALPYLKQAVQISPAESRAHEQLGKAYTRLEDLQNAQDQLETAAALAPDSASLHFMLGQVYRKRGMIDKARLELDRVTTLKQKSNPLILPTPRD